MVTLLFILFPSDAVRKRMQVFEFSFRHHHRGFEVLAVGFHLFGLGEPELIEVASGKTVGDAQQQEL